MPGGAIAPVAVTPTWGEPETSYWVENGWIGTGVNNETVDVNLIAPQVPGTYYLVVAMAGTYNGAQIMSGTHPGWAANWPEGNTVAELPASDFELGAAQGWIPFAWWSPNGPLHQELALTSVRIIVDGTPALNTVRLGSGSLAGQTVSVTTREITVEPGAALQGSFSIIVSNGMPESAISPVAVTPTWGNPETAYWVQNSWIGTGVNTETVDVNLTAPTTPGIYYLVVAMAGAYDGAQIMSGTHPGYDANWEHGNLVAELPTSNFELGAAQGWIPFDWWSPTGPTRGEMALTSVRIIVRTYVPLSTLRLGTGMLAGQAVSAEIREITVAPGAALQGSFSVIVSNGMPGGAIAPVAVTPTWGEPETSYWVENGWIGTGVNNETVDVNLIAPQMPGTYYLVVAMAGTYNGAQIMSGTHPAWAANWAEGNTVAELPASDFELGAAQGWIPFAWWSPNGPLHQELALTSVRIIVGSTVLLTDSGWNDGGFTFVLSGTAGRQCLVEASSDLKQWTSVATNTIPAEGRLIFKDSDSGSHTKRFYRLKEL